jgi:hypothetical protein
LSPSSKGITSGPFAPAAAFAVARWGWFIQRLAPSRFEETQGTLPPAVFWRFAAAGPPPAAGLPSAIAPAVLPMPVLRVGPYFRAIVWAILFLLDLACSQNSDGPRCCFLWFSFEIYLGKYVQY